MRNDEPERPILERIPTGIRGIDTVLNGGFLSGSVQLVIGRPGSGKTIFANQVAFRRAAAGQTAAYVTLLAESHARMLAHLTPFAFFDPNLVSRQVLYMSGYGVLEHGGLDGLLDLLTRTIREHEASLLVIDGIGTAKDFAPTANAFKRFLLSLSTSASLTGCMTLLVSTIDRTADARPESATVDGIIRLDKRNCGARVVREISIEKMRATEYALGPHAVEINREGLHVYPRIEAMPGEPFVSATKGRRVTFGVRGLDSMLGAGILAGSTTAIIGATGTGKTLTGLSFLAHGAQRGEPGIHVGLREPPDLVIHAAETIGLDLAKLVANGTLTLLWFPATEGSVDALAWKLLDIVTRERKQRVFIDGIEALQAMFTYPDRLERFFTGLTTQLAARQATTVMAEVAPRTSPAEETLALMSPNNVLLLSEEQRIFCTQRRVVALKVQAGGHDLSPRRMRISSTGVSVDKPWLEKLFEGKP